MMPNQANICPRTAEMTNRPTQSILPSVLNPPKKAAMFKAANNNTKAQVK
jgi:hypothetical protein